MKPRVPRWKDMIGGLYYGNSFAVYKMVPSPPIVMTKSIFYLVVSLLNNLYLAVCMVLNDFCMTLLSVLSSKKKKLTSNECANKVITF